MKRHTFAMKVKDGQVDKFRKKIRRNLAGAYGIFRYDRETEL